jgi:hypothetical protein
VAKDIDEYSVVFLLSGFAYKRLMLSWLGFSQFPLAALSQYTTAFRCFNWDSILVGSKQGTF